MAELRITICGEGSYSANIRDKVQALGLAEIVSFEGFVTHDQLIDHICAADVGVVAQLASEYSHLVNTNKMFEYIMLRRPVIATRLQSVSTTFSDDEIAFYEPGEGVSLAEAIRFLRDDPERRSALVENATAAHQSTNVVGKTACHARDRSCETCSAVEVVDWNIGSLCRLGLRWSFHLAPVLH